MDGIILIDKPKGWTSFDVVAKIRGQIKNQTGIKKPKVGHTGTLDPLATGLLVILVGKYCKKASEFTKLDKLYKVEATLGINSSTGDEEGDKTVVNNLEPTKQQIEETVKKFVGEIMQTPHKYSAIKVNGQRAYKLARSGNEVKLEPRSVTIYEIEEVKYKYPKLQFSAKVSSGTYIRSLVEDIGKELKTGAYMSDLKRLRVGDFTIENASDINGIDKVLNQMSL